MDGADDEPIVDAGLSLAGSKSDASSPDGEF